MGIFSRFADIVNANLNSILDKAEDPEKMIRLIIQEMEDTLVEVRTSSARTIAEKKELQRKIDKLKSEVDNWQQKAELAISKDREDLAKAALMEKKRLVELTSDMDVQLSSVNSTLDQLNVETGQLQDKLQDAKSRQSALVMRHKTASSRLKVREHLFSADTDDAMERFERYERKLDNLEANVDSQSMGRKRSLAEEIEGLEDDEKVNEELAALKKKMAGAKAPSKTDSKSKN
ncbi:MAG: phage shock protein PspA [Gammaproteobacteria bacterium]|nr:MAG: phage shock protein PspA [Gammaproteobacteria bacterium]